MSASQSNKPSVELLTNMAADSWKQKGYWAPEGASTFPTPQANDDDPNATQRIYNATFKADKSVLVIDDMGSSYDVQILKPYNPEDKKVYPPKYRFTGGRYPTSACGKSKSGNNPSRPSLFPATKSGATGTKPSKYFVMIESKQTGAKKLTILDIDPVSYQEMITAVTKTFGEGKKSEWRGTSSKTPLLTQRRESIISQIHWASRICRRFWTQSYPQSLLRRRDSESLGSPKRRRQRRQIMTIIEESRYSPVALWGFVQYCEQRDGGCIYEMSLIET
jgi:hypothetical protein